MDVPISSKTRSFADLIEFFCLMYAISICSATLTMGDMPRKVSTVLLNMIPPTSLMRCFTTTVFPVPEYENMYQGYLFFSTSERNVPACPVRNEMLFFESME